MATLNALKIKSLKKPGWYSDMPTLYLRVAEGGSRQWVQRLVVRGRRVDMGLGGFPLTSLADARERAFHNRRVARQGGDPRAERKRREQTPTFAEAVETVIALHAPNWKDGGRTAQTWRSSLRDYAVPALGDRLVSEITQRDVAHVVEAIWNEKRETALKLKSRLRIIMQWAMAKNYRETNPVDVVNIMLPKSEREQRHHDSVPYEKVGAVLEQIRGARTHPTTKLAFEFLILTATCSSETRWARWEEIDRDKRVWVIPPSRMKTAHEFSIPLSSRALDIVEEVAAYQINALLFPSVRQGVMSGTTLTKLCKNLQIGGTPHGFRSTFRTWAEEQTNVDFAVKELCLAHAVGSSVERAYNRTTLLEKRRRLMQQWADYVTGTTRADVIPLHG